MAKRNASGRKTPTRTRQQPSSAKPPRGRIPRATWDKHASFKKGQVVEYRCATGMRHVQVTRKAMNIKDGKPGFEGKCIWDGSPASNSATGHLVWGYSFQITRVDPPDHPGDALADAGVDNADLGLGDLAGDWAVR